MDQGGKYYIHRKDLLFPELSFRVNGVLIDVAKQLGGGHKEKYYQEAIRIGLHREKIPFKEQMYVPLTFDEQIVGKYFFDFYIENKIVLEIKRGEFIAASVINQTKQYLSAINCKLGILACFTHGGVVIKRVVNEY
ncbi:MAG: hypothetical protein A3C90_04280 [Candidatus Magasanikbacteria bacterium RIFCSPHIGHO2_02_FULL_51_14]|uniref:GxxExxY protein n=1 Tax=Candidatus Magasanikbacteria bacterium RIFCSPHIGHO2_02_FULL_51_14 TaxID=1798683 RepID=A0A1F6MDC5_9BACT|nr:MAG: hypothetical protein A3C90_04280 [Candidatus Magasanikbacteria bacterium RIFCSPHIGHO2_02_FULL_51_14]